MRDDFDIEDILKKYRGSPSSRVKKEVLAEFDRTFEGKDYRGHKARFWKRPVPLYMVAATLVVFMGLSYFAGKRAFRPDNLPTASKELIHEGDITEAIDITWRITQRDLL